MPRGRSGTRKPIAQGFYTFPLLPVGVYDLTVAAPGFATRTVASLSLHVGQSDRVDLTLQLARGQAVMQVEARPPLVQTASPAIGDEISNQRVTSLPLNGRQFSQLALLAAGAVPPYPNSATQQFNTPGLGLGFSVDGQRSERNNFSLDGITLIEPFAYSLTASPSTDAIREFRVVENSYSADQGMVSGAQVNIVSRSGSNRFAGTAYEFLRNSALDAKNYFDDPALPDSAFSAESIWGEPGWARPPRPDVLLYPIRRLPDSPEPYQHHVTAHGGGARRRL